MDHKRLIIDIALGAALIGLGGLAYSQHTTLGNLDAQLALIEARVDAVDPIATTAAKPLEANVPGEARPTAVAAGSAGTEPSVVPVVPRLGTKASTEFDASDPAVRGQLREVIQEEQELARVERHQERQERREQRLRQQVNELATKTSMDPDIGEQLTDLLVVEQVEAMDVFQQARENFGWDEAREKVNALRVETDAKAKDLLEEEEYAEYEKMRAEETNRWNRGSRGGRGQGDGRSRRNADENSR